MKYFQSLPKVIVTDTNRTSIVLTNLMARASIISELLKNPLLFYSYDIQESDTPEIIAHKYYGTMERYWLVLFANQLMDPQWDWPMNSLVFSKYLDDKYAFGELDVVQRYEKIYIQTDVINNIITTHSIEIGEDEYTTLMPSTNSYNLPTGTVIVEITKRAVTNYYYELELNESRRNIKLLNKSYASELETQLNKVMS